MEQYWGLLPTSRTRASETKATLFSLWSRAGWDRAGGPADSNLSDKLSRLPRLCS